MIDTGEIWRAEGRRQAFKEVFEEIDRFGCIDDFEQLKKWLEEKLKEAEK